MLLAPDWPDRGRLRAWADALENGCHSDEGLGELGIVLTACELAQGVGQFVAKFGHELRNVPDGAAGRQDVALRGKAEHLYYRILRPRQWVRQ